MKEYPEAFGPFSGRAFEPYRIVTVLSVSASTEDHASLRRLFSRTNWMLLEAYSCRDALAILGRHPIPVVISESTLPDGTWKDLLPSSEISFCKPCVIVSSRFADERMWMEVLDLGGFNLLEKPFDSVELFRVVSLAWLQWREQRGAPKLQVIAAAR